MSYNPNWNTSAQAGPSQPRLPNSNSLPLSSIPQPNVQYNSSLYANNLPTSGPSNQHTFHPPPPQLSAQEPDIEPEHQRSDSPPPTTVGLGQLVEPHQDLNEFLENFWTRQMDYVEKDNPDFRTFPLPLARIKKVMKSDEEVKMISAEAPIMFSKACDIFISELTCRAWLIAESKKRRTLQKSDVAAAIALSDMFDFLIDILPRDDDGVAEAEDQGQSGGAGGGGYEGGGGGGADEENGDGESGEVGEMGNGQYNQEGR